MMACVLAGCASAKTERARPANEVVSGGARVRGGGITMDVQVGHAVGRTPTHGGGTTLKPGAVVNP